MNNPQQNTSIYDTIIRLLILLLIITWCVLIMIPFKHIILWSVILAIALFPLHNSLTKKIGDRPKLASTIIILFFLIIFIIPAALLTVRLVEEVRELKVSYENNVLTIPPPNENVKEWPIIGNKVFDIWKAASVNLEQTILKYKDQLLDTGKKLANGIVSSTMGVIQIMISFIIAGILLAIGGGGEQIRKLFRKLAGEKGDEFADITVATVGSVVKGIIGVALILAFLHGIIFLLAGVPFAGIWTLMIFVLCVLQIPVIFITLPIIIYLFAESGVTTAIIWTIVLFLAGLSDNVLKPILLGKGAPVPMLVIFIGVIGGFIFSGFIGLFTGAIIMSIGYKLFAGWLNSSEKPVAEADTISG